MLKTVHRTLLTAAILWLTLAGSAAAQMRAFHQLPNGDWETTVTGRTGKTTRFVYVPHNKLSPTSEVRLAIEDAAAGRVAYYYSIANAASSAQPVLAIFFDPGRWDQSALEIEVAAIPGWEGLGGFLIDLYGGGIVPGGSTSFALHARALPGVVNLEFSGSHAVVEVPEDLTEAQFNELEELAETTHAQLTSAIGPAIIVGEATLPELVERVIDHYHPQFDKARHPQAAMLWQIHSGDTEASARAAATQLQELAGRPVSGTWPRELSKGLAACAQVLGSYRR